MAHRDLAEDSELRNRLEDFIRHHTLWHERVRHMKETGMSYDWHADMPYPRMLHDVIRMGYGDLKLRHAALLKKIPGAERRHIERQLKELYEPLTDLNLTGRGQFKQLLKELGQGSVFPLPNDEALNTWWRYCDKHFFPNNDERLRLMSQLHLLEGNRFPEEYVDYIDHWHTWKVTHLRWKKERVPYLWHSKRNYPRGLNLAVERSRTVLTKRLSQLPVRDP